MIIANLKQKLIDCRDNIRSQKIIKLMASGKIQDVADNYCLADINHLKVQNHTHWADIRDKLEHYNLHRVATKKRIKVAFVLYSTSMWSCEHLYKLFEENPRFDPYLIISRYTLDANRRTFPTFQKSLDSIRNSGYRVITIDEDTPKKKCYEAMGSPDIVFYLTPYSVLYPIGQNEIYMPSKVLCVYIPYSYMLIEAEEKYDCPGMVLSWRHFSDSNLYRQMLLNYSCDYSRNTFFVGYPKMDVYYEPESKTRAEIWKLPYGDKMKCIIYAPHHSLPGSETCTARFATFDKNYREILEYARSHQKTTSWIVKPHPNLKMTVLETGLFKNEDEYIEYLQEWEALPNARVVEEATYYDIFKTSDAMICDSVSFLAEYQFTGKPLLLLTREDNNFNMFGAKIAEQLYKVSGADIAGINDFIDEVVIKGNDYMKEERKAFFENNLDYRIGDKRSASEQIFDHILNAIDNA